MRKNNLVISHDDVIIPVAKYHLSIFDGDSNEVLQIFADSLKVVELGEWRYLKCYRRKLCTDLISLGNLDYIEYVNNGVVLYDNLAVDTLGSVLKKNLEKEVRE